MSGKTWAWTGYLIAVHVAFVALLVSANVPQRIAVRLGLLDEPDWPGIALMREVHRAQDATVPAGAVIFLGDSITQGLATAAVAPLSVNFGISGQRSDQLLQSMDGYRSMTRASAVVLMIGTNDLLHGRERGLGERYRAILAKIPPAVPVVMNGVPPMARLDVRPAVEAARTACAQRPGCFFVDAYSAMAERPGMLSDGVHLTPAGYAVWISLLRAGGHALPAYVTTP